MSKNNNVAHRVIDDFVKFQTSIVTDIGKFKTDVLRAVQEINKAVIELQTKHNDMAAHLVAVEGIARNTAGFAASEIGKMNGTVHRHLHDLDKSVNAIDINVLALAELAKEVIGQLTQIDVLIGKFYSTTKTLFSNQFSGLAGESADVKALTQEDINAFQSAIDLTSEEIREVKERAERWYHDLVSIAFKTVRNRLDAEDAERKKKDSEEAQKAKEEAEKLATDQEEAKAMEDELRKANSSESSVALISGGDGSPFPEGAEIFGG